MKIGWLNDYSKEEFLGGAVITNEIMISKGKKLGHEIIEFTAKDSHLDGTLEKIKDCDLLILNNINAFKKEVMDWIIFNGKYIKYEHDYSFCQFRNGRCDHCSQKCSPNPTYIKLYSNSLLNIFLSPLHLKIHKSKFGNIMRAAIFIPSPLEEGIFKKDKKLQVKDYLVASVISKHKGIKGILNFAERNKLKIDFAGRLIDKELSERMEKEHTYLGEVPFEKMPELYRQYKYFVINCDWPEPFGRMIIEAIASGCEIINFDSTWETGYESYDLSQEKMIEKCLDAPNVFWKKIKDVI